MSRPLGALQSWSGALLVLCVTTATAIAATAGAAAAVPQRWTSAVSATATRPAPGDAPVASGQGLKTVRYRGVAVRVPSGWPVVDLDADPTGCVRLDRAAVYVGTPAAQQDCPAHAVGRAATVWLAPAVPSDRSLSATGRRETLGGLTARVVGSDASQEQQVILPDAGVVVRAAWGTNGAQTQDALGSIASAVGPTAAAVPSPLAAAAPTDALSATGDSTFAPAASAGAVTTAAYLVNAAAAASVQAVTAGTGGRQLTGMAFDTCAAPSAASMSAWRSSPYAAVGIYIGGSMRACGDGNLSASWVSTVTGNGWGLIPIYVGPQAPCVGQSGLAKISTTPATAATQGTANAADAIVQAQRFGLGAGAVIYYDMESYATGNASCTQAVLTFVTAWTVELHRQGYRSGVYGNPGSLMTDMSRAITARNASFTAPDHVWYAHWNQVQNTSDAASYPGFPDSYWPLHQRLHQYSGGAIQTWGGVSINIDANWVDAPLPGNPVQVSYGANILGPGSAGFVFTGPMTYWHPSAPAGAMGRAYWTHPNGTTAVEGNGATWAPALATGLYGVDAYVPTATNGGVALYAITDSTGAATARLDQSAGSGYRRIGTVLKEPGSSVAVHFGDNAGSAAASTLWADAMRFTLLASLPGAPPSPAASSGEGTATVAWQAAAANGGAISTYTVTASPGGATVTVPGTSLSASFTGLSNRSSYTFTVTAKNVVGTGPASTPTGAIVPVADHIRLSGADRYGTAVAVSKAMFPSGSWPDGTAVSTVLVASAGGFPDALAGGPLAALYGPLLLVPTTGTVPSAVTDEIQRLAPAHIVVLGGSGAVGKDVLAALGKLAPVRVISGSDRYATAARVALETNTTLVSSRGTRASVAFLASGATFADALSGSSAAAATQAALLLTAPSALPAVTASALGQLKPTTVYVLGGTAAVSAGVLSAVQRLLPGASVVRLGGADRFGTAAAISRAIFPSSATVLMANASNFPDALAGAPLAAMRDAPLLLTAQPCVPRSTVSEIQRLDVTTLVVIGGPGVVSDAAERVTSC